jgi:hypothetical protein
MVVAELVFDAPNGSAQLATTPFYLRLLSTDGFKLTSDLAERRRDIGDGRNGLTSGVDAARSNGLRDLGPV